VKTRALCQVAPGRTEVRERAVPELGPHDLLVRIRVGGVCRGDVEVFRGGEDVPLPYYGGHEGAGTVEAIGRDVSRFAPGDNVALLGDGRFSEWSVAAENQAARLPARIDDWASWVVEPMACCVNGVEVAGILPDDVVGVVGCGFMGLSVIRVLDNTLLRQLIGFDIRAERLASARASGATATFRSDGLDVLQEVEASVDRRPMPTSYVLPGLQNGPLDVVFETSGSAEGLDLAAELARVGGTVVMFGHQRGKVQIDGTLWHMKGLRVLNASPMIASDFHQIFYRTAALMTAGRLTLDGLITHTGDLANADDILARATEPDYVKGALYVDLPTSRDQS
jgi:threonine dehydrogenase-like Zn-dependent dehydrogenase